ncbi:glycosyltransferase [Streptomyces sp. NPDC087300]|uniref:glycosyltransferase n=1 Tax=Streptomyces sp. NPDC087300 TaxID=3365780 RepID=UPI003806E36F
MSFGLIVQEALSRAVPAIASNVGGIPEALGKTPAGEHPGLLLPPGVVADWADGLRAWLTDGELRDRLRRAAGMRRTTLPDWSYTARAVAAALSVPVGRHQLGSENRPLAG